MYVLCDSLVTNLFYYEVPHEILCHIEDIIGSDVYNRPTLQILASRLGVLEECLQRGGFILDAERVASAAYEIPVALATAPLIRRPPRHAVAATSLRSAAANEIGWRISPQMSRPPDTPEDRMLREDSVPHQSRAVTGRSSSEDYVRQSQTPQSGSFDHSSHSGVSFTTPPVPAIHDPLRPPQPAQFLPRPDLGAIPALSLRLKQAKQSPSSSEVGPIRLKPSPPAWLPPKPTWVPVYSSPLTAVGLPVSYHPYRREAPRS